MARYREYPGANAYRPFGQRRSRAGYYKVVAGDTWNTIADLTGTTPDRIANANKIAKPIAGTTIRLPKLAAPPIGPWSADTNGGQGAGKVRAALPYGGAPINPGAWGRGGDASMPATPGTVWTGGSPMANYVPYWQRELTPVVGQTNLWTTPSGSPVSRDPQTGAWYTVDAAGNVIPYTPGLPAGTGTNTTPTTTPTPVNPYANYMPRRGNPTTAPGNPGGQAANRNGMYGNVYRTDASGNYWMWQTDPNNPNGGAWKQLAKPLGSPYQGQGGWRRYRQEKNWAAMKAGTLNPDEAGFHPRRALSPGQTWRFLNGRWVKWEGTFRGGRNRAAGSTGGGEGGGETEGGRISPGLAGQQTVPQFAPGYVNPYTATSVAPAGAFDYRGPTIPQGDGGYGTTRSYPTIAYLGLSNWRFR
jgi:hypothetical protein